MQDTTSHNFKWQKFTFGQHSSSALYDVAIIDENNIWAVGEIYTNDTLGNPDPYAYNALHWDGIKWEVKKITVLYKGNLITPTLYGIYAFSKSEIWLSSGIPMKGDGVNWTQYHLFDMGILSQQDGYLTKFWGSSPNDLYCVGTLGTIAHYNGISWQKIESGTKLNIYDIWGDFNEKTNEWEILAVASHLMHGAGNKILQITGTTAKTISNNPISGYDLAAVWFIPESHYYAGGDGIYEKTSLADSNWGNDPLTISRYSTTGIHGNGLNDMFVVGAFGEVLHFNGSTWKSFINEGTGINGSYGRIAMKNDLVVIVGFVGIQAIITVGKRK